MMETLNALNKLAAISCLAHRTDVMCMMPTSFQNTRWLVPQDIQDRFVVLSCYGDGHFNLLISITHVGYH